MDKLPIAIVIPHAGLALQPEVDGRIALAPEQIFNEMVQKHSAENKVREPVDQMGFRTI